MRLIRTLALLLFAAITHVHAQNSTNENIVITEVSTDRKYGYNSESIHSIKVGTIPNEYTYLAQLTGPNGEKLQYNRVGSCCNFSCSTCDFGMGLLDKWEITYKGLKKPLVIYLNGYEYETPKCPLGLGFKKGQGTQPPVTSANTDSATTVNACHAKTIYSADDLLLRESISDELEAADKNPAYKGGPDSLKNYFRQHPLTDENAKQLIFRVHIGFLVNCDGIAGNFFLVSKGKGDLETYANQVLAIVKQMPRKWLPAVKNGKAVDSYQVLSFTVSDGLLDKVSYK